MDSDRILLIVGCHDNKISLGKDRLIPGFDVDCFKWQMLAQGGGYASVLFCMLKYYLGIVQPMLLIIYKY